MGGLIMSLSGLNYANNHQSTSTHSMQTNHFRQKALNFTYKSITFTISSDFTAFQTKSCSPYGLMSL
jgi:hypothetical protein